MSNRYWVKLTLEIRNYDEAFQTVGKEYMKFEPATNLTPEPAKFIGKTLSEQAQKLATFIQDEAEQVSKQRGSHANKQT